MTREELKQAGTKKLISALQYCGRDSYYATYYDEVVDEITQRLNRIEALENEIEQLQRINSEQKETLKKVRVALIQERTANLMNYGKGGVEMFDSIFEVLKGVSN